MATASSRDRAAVIAMPKRELFVQVGTGHVLEVADATLAFARAFVSWAGGDGKRTEQVHRYHLELLSDLLAEVGIWLKGVGIVDATLPPEGYNEKLRNLVLVAGRHDGLGVFASRYEAAPDAEAARTFLNEHWPRALEDMARAMQTRDLPRDPPGASQMYALRRLRALLSDVVAIEAHQSV